MLNLKNITLVSMTSVNVDETVMALMKSSSDINFGSIKLISHRRPDYLPDSIDFCLIDKINNVDEYSYKMIYNLGDYIDTEYALIVQHDGYVINPQCWDSNFLNYDYIGAPWIIPNEFDKVSFRDETGVLHRVGNGGFSLRSKKLIDIPNRLNIEWESYRDSYNEDGFICVFKRHIYEENGCKFSPLDVAKYFSHEAEIPEIEGITPFGFHGKWSKYKK